MLRIPAPITAESATFTPRRRPQRKKDYSRGVAAIRDSHRDVSLSLRRNREW